MLAVLIHMMSCIESSSTKSDNALLNVLCQADRRGSWQATWNVKWYAACARWHADEMPRGTLPIVALHPSITHQITS